jgi:hypothetical protein
VLDVCVSTLSGSYHLASIPPVALLAELPGGEEAMRRAEAEWQDARRAVDSDDGPFPADPAWLSGRGAYRKYGYAAVVFCPFTYHPRSGRLEHHDRIRVAIHCEFPARRSAREADLLDRLLADRVGEAQAAASLAGYAQVADLYTRQARGASPPDETYDYVIITAPAIQGAISLSSFQAWKTSQGFHLRTVLTTDSEIASQSGADLAEQIRNFLRSFYASWGIEYVLLVGDYATVPMRVCYPDPENHVYDPSTPGLVAAGMPTDYYYADLSYPDATSWDSDGDGYPGEYTQDHPDFCAEVSVGRIPVNATARIIYTLDKLVAFEQDTGAWKNNVLHGGTILFFEHQNGGAYPLVDGANCLDSLETGLMGGLDVTHLSEQEGLVTSPFAWPAISEESFTGHWRTGQHAIVNWSGHGWSNRAMRSVWAWDDGDGIPESGTGEIESPRIIDIDSSLDDDHPSIVFAISCNVGFPEPNPYGNLGIDLLTYPGRGASAGIVSAARSAAVSYAWRIDPRGAEQICYDFNRYMIQEGTAVGTALYRGKFDAHTLHPWEHVYEYMNLYDFNLYGDPSLEVGCSVTGVADRGREASTRGLPLHLEPITPNPSPATATLRFVLPGGGPVHVAVHDVAGRHVETLARGHFEAGEIEVTWDGRRDGGERAASGIYFLVVDTGRQRQSRKLVLIR